MLLLIIMFYSFKCALFSTDPFANLCCSNPVVNHKHFYRKNPFSVNSMNVPYDYDSITHMSRWYLGKRDARGNILKTIVTLDHKKKYSIGQRSHLSQSDVLQLNLLYKCPGKYF